jgi:hypothetical protein
MFKKIIVSTNSNIFRLCFVNVNNKIYEINSIHIFNTEGIIYETSSGWFEKIMPFKEDIISFKIHEPSFKRKIDFSFDGNFIISKGKDKYSNTLKCDLYIHESDASVTLIEEKALDFETDTTLYYHNIYEIQIDDITFKTTAYNSSELKTFGLEIKEMFNKFKKFNIDILNDNGNTS